MIDYQTPLYRTSEVAMACGIPAGTLRSFFRRGQFRVIGKEREGEGLAHYFSLRDAMTFALATKLVAIGIDAEKAFNAAVLHFAHTGDEKRDPAALYDVHEKGLTAFVYWPDSDNAEVIGEEDIAGLYQLRLSTEATPREGAAVIVILNYIETAVFAALEVSN